MSKPNTDAETRLMAYVTGWKRGAYGAAVMPAQSVNPDFSAGYNAGRNAAKKAYCEACKFYGAELSPLRGDAGLPNPNPAPPAPDEPERNPNQGADKC